MALRLASLLFLLLAAAAAELSRSAPLPSLEAAALLKLAGEPSGQCGGGLVGECGGEDEEMDYPGMHRRGLQTRFKFISYQALLKNRVPCNQRGYSYYNCNRSGARRANPYRRGCTYITHCRRILN